MGLDYPNGCKSKPYYWLKKMGGYVEVSGEEEKTKTLPLLLYFIYDLGDCHKP